MTPHHSRCRDGLMLTTPHLLRKEPLEPEWIVVWSATRKKLSFRQEVTIQNRDVATITNPTMILIIFALGLTVVMDYMIQRSGNGDMTNRWTTLAGRSNIEIQVMVRDFWASMYILIIEWFCMIPEIYCNTKGVTQSIKSQFPLRLPRVLPPADWVLQSTTPIPIDHGRQVHLQIHSIMAYKCISKLTQSQHRSISPKSHDCGLQVYLQTPMIASSKFARSQHPSAFPNSPDHGLGVHFQTRLVTASKWISKLAPVWPLSSLDHALQVHLQTRLTSECISVFTRSWPPSGSPEIVGYPLQVHL